MSIGCSKEDEKTENSSKIQKLNSTHIYQNLPPYKDWQKFKQGNIIFIHPPNHLHESRFDEFASIFSALERQVCTFLQIQSPDSLIFYFYTGVGHGAAVTGYEYSFSDGKVIHFWFPSFFGTPLVKHLLPDWESKKPHHEFLAHGIIALLDGSGQNYHQMTLKHIDTGVFIHLRELAADTSVDVNTERLQSAEAASFVDYIVYTYGIDNLKQLYIGDNNFELDVQRVFKVPIDSLEQSWLEFIETFAGIPENESG